MQVIAELDGGKDDFLPEKDSSSEDSNDEDEDED